VGRANSGFFCADVRSTIATTIIKTYIQTCAEHNFTGWCALYHSSGLRGRASGNRLHTRVRFSCLLSLERILSSAHSVVHSCRSTDQAAYPHPLNTRTQHPTHPGNKGGSCRQWTQPGLITT
jgi:hypothetical protein